MENWSIIYPNSSKLQVINAIFIKYVILV